MNYDIFNRLCREKGTTPTAVALKLGLSKGNTSSWKKGGNPSAEILIKLSDELNCTIDSLLGKKSIITDYLSINERELLMYFNKLPEKEQIKLISRAETLAEQYTEKSQNEIRLNDQTDDDEEIIINVAARGLGVTSVTTTKKAMEELLSLEPEDDIDF